MQYLPIQNTIITTTSGMIGGVTKALTAGFTLARITISNMLEIAIYAAISALVGYLVKFLIDELRAKYQKKQSRKSK